jgi:hypothetical protein
MPMSRLLLRPSTPVAMAIKDVPLADAKWLAHGSDALADGRLNREAAWAAMYEEVANMPE